MKKHLIAAAVAGAFAVPAMAQVTVSGQFGIAYGKGLAPATANAGTGSAAGMRISDGDIRFSASEDLGGGMKASASLELRVRGRGTVDDGPTMTFPANNGATTGTASTGNAHSGIGGRNASVSLSGGFGTIDGGSIEFANGIYGRGSAGAPIALPDELNRGGLVISSQGNVDYLRYTTPALVPGMNIAVIYADGVGTGRTISGISGTSNRYKNSVAAMPAVQLNYKAGPIDFSTDYTIISVPTAETNTTVSDTVSSKRTRIRVSGSYNLGVATIGAGYETREQTANKNLDNEEYVVGVSIPLGSLTVGAVYLNNQTNDNTAYGFGAQYALSKRTSLNFSFADKDGTASHGVSGGTTAEGSQYSLRLLHTF